MELPFNHYDVCASKRMILKDEGHYQRPESSNDLAERYIKDIQEYADLATDLKYREDILIVVADYRGVFQDL